MGLLEELFLSEDEYRLYEASKKSEIVIATADTRMRLGIYNPDDAAHFLDNFISHIKEHRCNMVEISYVMRYLNVQSNRDLFRKYDAYFRSENVPKAIKESYAKLYRKIISVV